MKKVALIIGHPGHELRAYKFIKDYQPHVFILTDGSGSLNGSRISNSIKLLDSLGAKYMNLFKPFTDKKIYQLILEHKMDEIVGLKNLIEGEIYKNEYDMILGDALEGFNPIHDLCRYLINSIVKKNNLNHPNSNILNCAFELDSAPNKFCQDTKFNGFSLKLDNIELESKLATAMNYPELKYEVSKAIELFGKEAFSFESFIKIDELDIDIINNWKTLYPVYESYGKQRVNSGLYKDVIGFEKHMKPIAESLLRL